jgi:hypothetical protein
LVDNPIICDKITRNQLIILLAINLFGVNEVQMNTLERFVWLEFHVDNNRINARRNLKDMNVLEYWHENDVIYMEMSEVAQKEAARGGNTDRFEKAYTYVGTETLASPSDKLLMDQIGAVIFPHGIRSQRQKNDVEIVFNAKKYERILITDDGGSRRQPGGILGNREKLRLLGIQVMRDYEAVELVKHKIIERDEFARIIASRNGEPLPNWIGKDLDILCDT